MRLPGQYFDSETNLHYNYFRYYDPSVGRYITSDPIGLNGGPNTYSYVVNNPVRFEDFFGLVHPKALVEGCNGVGCRMNNTPERGDIRVFIQGCAFGICTETPLDGGDPQMSVGTTVVGGGFMFCEEPAEPRPESCDNELIDASDFGLGKTLSFEFSNDGRRCINVGVGLGSPIGGSRDLF